MSVVVFSPLAQSDLDELLDYIARDKPTAAVNFVQRIRETCDLLAKNPQMGELRPDLAPTEIRSLSVGSYVILFRRSANGIEVARVVSGFRDFRNITIG